MKWRPTCTTTTTVNSEAAVHSISGLYHFNQLMKPSVVASNITALEEALLPWGVCLQKMGEISTHRSLCCYDVRSKSTTNGSTNEVPDTDVTNARCVRFFWSDGESVCRAPATLQLDRRGSSIKSRAFRKLFVGKNYAINVIADYYE